MKFKSMKIDNTLKRQTMLANESDKEEILYYEPVTWEEETNNEFVVGLPLTVREYSSLKLEELAAQIRSTTLGTIPEPFAVAIHNKKLEDEVHFHLSYQNIDVEQDSVKSLYENLV